jgi:hypothetical protein
MYKFNGSAAVSALFVLLAHIAMGQDGNGFRGYKIGRYFGDAANATNKGRVTFEIKNIVQSNGETTAHFNASGGLYGDADLKGWIDQSGVLSLSGNLAGFAMSVVGRVTGATIQATYRLTNSSSSQDGTFTATLTSDADLKEAALLKPGKFRGQQCSYDAAAGIVSRTEQASEQLFKRVLYNWFDLDVKEGGTTNPLKVGVTFLEFQMGAPFTNRVFVDPGTGAQRLHDGAPVGATIYPVKTTYIHCGRYRGSTERRVTQQNFACFKDRFDDWACPVDSVPVNLEKISIPD